MTVILNALSEMSLDMARKVGFENEGVSFSDAARARIRAGRAAFERLLASDEPGFVYGSTAAPGARAKMRLSSEQQAKLAQSQNAWAPRCFGVESKWVPDKAVRLVLLARLAGYLGGHGRVRLETAEWVAARLDRPPPRMPLDSATGPGEVMPLSWLYPDLPELDLAAGEIMSLFNGSPCATAFATHAALTAERRLSFTEALSALAIEAVGAPLDAYDPALIDLTADPHHQEVLRRLNSLLTGVPRVDRLPHQAPVSWRIIPSVLATAAKAVDDAKTIAEQSLRSVAHNPVYLPPDAEHPNGRAVSSGGFHNQPASRALDALNAAYADVAVLSAKHTARLLDGAPFGLPRLLVAPDSGAIGAEFLAWSQTSHAERARHAATPATLPGGLEDPGGGQSDVASPVFLAFERSLDAADALDASLATLAVTVLQAFRLTGRRPPPPLTGLHGALDALVAPVELETIDALGASVRAVKKAVSDSVDGAGPLA